jgi:hypothetical protein
MMMPLDAKKIKKYFILVMIMALVLFMTACTPSEETEPTEDTPTEVIPMNLVSKINLITENPKAYEKVEFAIEGTELLAELEFNPYDYREISIRGIFEAPSGEMLAIPAFWYVDYEISLNTAWPQQPTGISGRASTDPNEPQGLEMVTFSGDPHYRLRYLPKESGEHKIYIEVSKQGAIVQVFQSLVYVEASEEIYRGTIKVEPNHQRNFIFEDGTTFIPIGQNTAWYTSSTRQTEDFRVWFEKMNANHANFTRVWMAPWGFALHWGGSHNNFDNRQSAAARMDKMFELAETYDIYFMLALLNHGQFSANVNPQWHLNPWNKNNGGPLEYPSQFFTLFEAKETYKQQLLYILGRYGYSSKVMAWELFNEVDWTDNFNSTAVFMWHSEMSQFLKQHDAYNRMVTTSYKGHTGGAYQSQWIDFANPHSYDYTSKNMMVHLTPVLNSLHNNYKKPILQSEIGINWQNGTQTTQADPTGISLKQAQWAGMMGGGAGGAMNWWWDSWVHSSNLYYRFIGAGLYAKEMNMVGETYDRLNALSGVTVSNNQTGLIGYRIDQRIYGYAFDNQWRHNYTTIADKTVQYQIPIAAGTYTMRIFNTDTGLVVETRNLTSNGNLNFQLAFREDIAFIIEVNS